MNTGAAEAQPNRARPTESVRVSLSLRSSAKTFATFALKPVPGDSAQVRRYIGFGTIIAPARLPRISISMFVPGLASEGGT